MHRIEEGREEAELAAVAQPRRAGVVELEHEAARALEVLGERLLARRRVAERGVEQLLARVVGEDVRALDDERRRGVGRRVRHLEIVQRELTCHEKDDEDDGAGVREAPLGHATLDEGVFHYQYPFASLRRRHDDKSSESRARCRVEGVTPARLAV